MCYCFYVLTMRCYIQLKGFDKEGLSAELPTDTHPAHAYIPATKITTFVVCLNLLCYIIIINVIIFYEFIMCWECKIDYNRLDAVCKTQWSAVCGR